jgi:hypothetical protein
MASTTIVAANNVRRFLFSSSSSTRRVLRSPSSPLTMVSSSLSRTNTTILTRGGDHHDDHTMEPPFHRLPLPSKPVSKIEFMMIDKTAGFMYTQTNVCVVGEGDLYWYKFTIFPYDLNPLQYSYETNIFIIHIYMVLVNEWCTFCDISS